MTSLLDPCPWHQETKPSAECNLAGPRDDPTVVIRLYCPVCNVSKYYYPTEKEVQDHYESRYSHNLPLVKAVISKLVNAWNWKYKHAI